MNKKKWIIAACAAVLLIAAAAVLIKSGVLVPKKKVYIPEGTTVNVRKEFTAQLTEIEDPESDSETASTAKVTSSYKPQSEFPFTVSGKLSVSKMFPYSGGFVEDGSDKAVENICAIRVKNISDLSFQYVSLRFKTDAGDIVFDLTALPAGETVTVLAKNAEPYRSDTLVSEVIGEKIIEFSEKPSLHGELFELSVQNGVMGIRNISADKSASNVYVYYKSTDENGLFGGITYRINLGDIPAEKFKQVSPPHFSESSSKVMYITYV